MEYTLVEDTDLLQFHEKVKRLIEDNWNPQGGVSVCMIQEGRFAYFQAMIRTD